MSYYYIEKRNLTTVTLPVNCETYSVSSPADSKGYQAVHLHHHEPLELIVMKRGTAIWTADDRTYRVSAGDVLLLNPYVLHSAEIPQNSEAEYLCITFSLSSVLGFQNSVLSQCALSLSDGVCFLDEFYPADEPDTIEMVSVADSMFEKFHKKTPESECEIMSCLYRLLSKLLETHYHENHTNATYKRNKQFLQKISIYLDANHQKPITSKDAAEALFLSVSRFSHIFHQHFGMSFSKYLCQYRVRRAATYYVHSTLPITQIAADVGFSDYCYFSRSFKQYIGTSPARYFGRRKTTESDSE